MDLKGRTALITGAAGGLGRIVAETLAELGADLILVDRPGSNLQQCTEQLGLRWGVHVRDIFCDLEQSNQRQQLIEQVKAMKSGLNILVNNAAFVGTSELKGWSVPFEQQSVDTWRRAVEVNLTAVFELTQGFSSNLSVARGGCIINIAASQVRIRHRWRLY